MKAADVFVAGYGSFRNSATLPNPDSQRDQVKIKGYAPAFNARITFPTTETPKRTLGTTALGLVPTPTGLLEATLIQVTPSQLKELDIRETCASERIKVPIENIIFNGHAPEGDTTVWIYRPKKPQLPDPDFPLDQSYVDVVLGGYYEAGGEAAMTRFAQTVTGWESYWINDREEPQYPRALNYLMPRTKKLVKIIDTVLLKTQSAAVQSRIDINAS